MAHEAQNRKPLPAKLGGLLKSAAFGWVLRVFPLLGLTWSVWGAWRRYRARVSARRKGQPK